MSVEQEKFQKIKWEGNKQKARVDSHMTWAFQHHLIHSIFRESHYHTRGPFSCGRPPLSCGKPHWYCCLADLTI